MSLTVTTLTYHHLDYVQRLTEALDRQAGALPAVERLLVDNGSRPGHQSRSAAYARDAGWHVLEPGYNTSYAEGHNLAAREARGEWLLHLNDDAVPEPGFLAALWASREAADVTGALLLYPDGRVNHAGGGLRPWPYHLGRWQPRGDFEGRGVQPMPWVTGAVLLVHRDTFQRLGGLDEVYHYGCEDSDLCLRAVEAGLRVGVNWNAVAVHGELGTRPGGAADLPNEAIFRQRWLAKFEALEQKAQANWRH